MKIELNFLLISLFLCKYILYIKDIYFLNDNNNYSIILDIKSINISKKFIKNNIFNIVLESENILNKNTKITFICNYINLLPINFQIKCLLKKKVSSNLVGHFYFRKENFKKSFIINFKDEFLYFTLEILEEDFYIAMIKNFRVNKTIFNFKISNVIIPISMVLNNEFIYPTIVSITSILENAFSYTKYNFYILLTPDFLNENKKKLKFFEKKYYNKCSINLIDIINFKFKNANLSRHIQTIASYYRLILPDLLVNIDKIIYLDGDTLIFGDLKEMFDINMDNYYFKGFLDINERFNLKIDNYICAGVLLINLENLRNDKIVNKMYNYMIKNNKNLYFHDQSIINDVCKEKIGILPPKFGIFNYYNLKTLYKFTNKAYRYKKYRYSKAQLREAYLNPTILNCIIKPWRKKKKIYGKKIWLNFAKKTNYYKEIKKKYKL